MNKPKDFLKQLRKLVRVRWWKRIYNFFFRRKQQDISVSGSGTKDIEELQVGDRIYAHRYEKNVEAMISDIELKLAKEKKFEFKFDPKLIRIFITTEMKKKSESEIGDWLWNSDDEKCDPIITPPTTDIS